MKQIEQINTFKFFIALCVIAIFPNGLFNYYLQDWRALKILTELGIYGLIFLSILTRTPKIGFVKFVIVNGLIVFFAFEIGNFFTFIMIRQSKYFDAWIYSLIFGFILIMIGTLIFSLIGMLIKKTFANK